VTAPAPAGITVAWWGSRTRTGQLGTPRPKTAPVVIWSAMSTRSLAGSPTGPLTSR
jgi:hypothetical protein